MPGRKVSVDQPTYGRRLRAKLRRIVEKYKIEIVDAEAEAGMDRPWGGDVLEARMREGGLMLRFEFEVVWERAEDGSVRCRRRGTRYEVI